MRSADDSVGIGPIIPSAMVAAAHYIPAHRAAQVVFGTIKIDGLDIAYREAGDLKSPKLVLLPFAGNGKATRGIPDP